MHKILTLLSFTKKIRSASVLICFLLFSKTQFLFAQPCLLVKYSYLSSPTFDKIVQTYNFSRPWYDNKLKPLTNGYGGSLGWNWEIVHSRAVHLLPEIGYSYFSTTASNLNKEFKVGFHQFDISASLRTHPKCLIKPVQSAGPLGTRWYISLVGGISSFLPFAQTNGASLTDTENKPYRALSTTFNFSIGTGYHFVSVGRFVLTPDVCLHWYPEMELVNFAEAVNGHNLSGLRNQSSNVFFLQAGLRITYIKSRSNWWDKPRQGDKT